MYVHFSLIKMSYLNYNVVSGGSTLKSFWHMPPLPTGPNSFIFTCVFTEKCPCWMLAPPPMRVGTPPMGNPGSAPVVNLNTVATQQAPFCFIFISHFQTQFQYLMQCTASTVIITLHHLHACATRPRW